MKAKAADRAVLGRQAGIGHGRRQRIESDTVIVDHPRNRPVGNRQANPNIRFPFAYAMHENIADHLVKRDKNLGGDAIGHGSPRQKSLRIIHQALQTGMSVRQDTVEFGRHDTDRPRMQGEGLRKDSLIEWKNFSITT